MTTTSEVPAPPAGIGDRSAALWREVVGSWVLDGPGLVLLTELVHAVDRADAARALLAAEGLTVTDRYHQVKPNPAATIEHQAATRVKLLMAALDLDLEPADAEAPRTKHRKAKYRS